MTFNTPHDAFVVCEAAHKEKSRRRSDIKNMF
jgi:hypothetical protein